MRVAEIKRTTAETDIYVKLNLDGTGQCDIDSGIGFFDHMLILFAKHSRFDLTVKCNGDIWVDGHHTTEDIGIALGQAFKEAIGDKRGIHRYGSTILPMDEALILSAVDISGRAYLQYYMNIPAPMVGDFDTELLREFFVAFAFNSAITLHIKQLDGVNSHHLIEGAFKSVARTLKKAVAIDEAMKNEIPSSKGVL
ncbi:MAG: imidazoleglycerol-phosphate dehydratase HisB [Clostridia bacterium]|nr:imidazoleglycerol-phosphate dehydratase HisB [Clostridia bacterium]